MKRVARYTSKWLSWRQKPLENNVAKYSPYNSVGLVVVRNPIINANYKKYLRRSELSVRKIWCFFGGSWLQTRRHRRSAEHLFGSRDSTVDLVPPRRLSSRFLAMTEPGEMVDGVGAISIAPDVFWLTQRFKNRIILDFHCTTAL